MTETAGFGVGAWLPRQVQAAWRQEAQEEQRQARQAEAEKAERIESRRSSDLELYRSQCEARGEAVDVVSFATGRVTGRSAGAVLAEAAAAADAADARAEYEERRKRGERLNLIGLLEDPVDSQPGADDRHTAGD